MTPHLRTLWLSDVHLGTAAARAGELLGFLGNVSADRIFLVGDIVDIERIRARPSFPDLHWQVLARLAAMAREGMEIVYIPGNHDREVRALAGSHLCGVRIALEARHRTAAGEELLVVHGDCLDARVRSGTGLEKFGAAAYAWLVDADATINRVRSRLGRDHTPIAARIKARLQSAQAYIARFERCAAAYAAERGMDGIVCGHIHRPAVRRLAGVRYVNDGDWVEHCSAVAESPGGELELLELRSGTMTAVEKSDGKALAAA